jgi:tripartite-type tricarboxylate transporter receptor subunit TctC
MKLFIKFFLVFGLLQSAIAGQLQELFIGFAPGGPSDIAARLILKNKLSMNYVVVNKPGANGQLAVREMQEKKAMSLAVMENIFVNNKIIYKENIIYNTDDLEVIGLIALNPAVLACRADLGFKTVQDLISYKKNLNFASTAVNGVEEITSKMFFKKINKEHQIIHYITGGNKPVLDLLGGHIDCYFANLPTINAVLNNDKLNLIISTHDISFTGIKVPTWNEEYKEKFPIQVTLGLIVDKSLHSSMKEKIINDFQTELTSTELRKEMLIKGLVPIGIFGESAKSENEKILRQYQKVINELGIK